MVDIEHEMLVAEGRVAKVVRECDIEAHLVKRVKQFGGMVRKVKWIGHRNAPDRVVMIESLGFQGVTIWVELKRPGGKATFPKDAHERAQHREHERMRALGQTVVVIDSYEDAENILRLKR